MGQITLKNMRFQAFHGFYESERKSGNLFELDVHIELDLTTAGSSGSLEDSINYEKVYSLCALHMSQSRPLLETVLAELLKDMAAQFALAQSIQIDLRKIGPQLGGPLGYVELSDSWNR